jgi:thiamine biosynthesis lipoprotein
MKYPALISLLLVLISPVKAEWYKESQGIMGTPINVELWSHSESLAKSCTRKVMDEMRRIDALMSPYKPESELAIINSKAYQQDIKISQELFRLIERSIVLSELSEGAFDITFASIGYQYDYRKKQKPSDQQIQAQLDRINYRHIKLDKSRSTIRFAREGVRIDLGGIAKGYAVDNGIRILKECGIKRALVSAGGDSRILGDRKGRPWMTGIRDPRRKDESVVIIPLSDTAMSTSGDYERYFIKDGVRYHHILSPKTGKSVKETRSVTVLGPDAVTTDGLSTTLFVLGPDKGLALAERLEGIDAVIIDAKGRIHYSSGLMPPGQGSGNSPPEK